MKKCYIDGCEEKSHTRKMCRRHLRKWRLYGDPLVPDKKLGPVPTLFCSVDGCFKKFHAKGFCTMHYTRVLTHGTPDNNVKTREEMYHSSYNKLGKNECWPWIRNLDKNGYGKLGFKNFHTDRAHRFGWELFHKKPIPHGMLVCHTCDNPPCQNPAHLFIGTNMDNMQDKVRKGRLVANPYKDAKGRFGFKPR